MTRSFFVVIAAALCAAPSCHSLPPPDPTPPAPSVWPPTSGDPCDAECANLDAHHCPGAGVSCAVDCRHLDFVLSEHSQSPVDHACMAARKTCEEIAKCH